MKYQLVGINKSEKVLVKYDSYMQAVDTMNKLTKRGYKVYIKVVKYEN